MRSNRDYGLPKGLLEYGRFSVSPNDGRHVLVTCNEWASSQLISSWLEGTERRVAHRTFDVGIVDIICAGDIVVVACGQTGGISLDIESSGISLSPPDSDIALDGTEGFESRIRKDRFLTAFKPANDSVCVWNHQTQKWSAPLRGHSDSVMTMAFVSDSILASGSMDKTIRVWDTHTHSVVQTLEGHTSGVIALALVGSTSLLVSLDEDGNIQVWDTATWDNLAHFNLERDDSEVSESRGVTALEAEDSGILLLEDQRLPNRRMAAHPSKPIVATEDRSLGRILFWELSPIQLDALRSPRQQYANAKVVLLGDSGVGKSGLGIVLSGRSFRKTDSTHGRHVRRMTLETQTLPEGRSEVRETLLWDLAGQPGYRLIHQLHLSEVAVALVVFDSRSESDPLSGIRHWDRALKQAVNVEGASAVPLKKFLVAARTDRGGIPASDERIQAMIKEGGFDGYFQTSAREGWNTEELRTAVLEAIAWDDLPRVTSNKLFRAVKAYLVSLKARGNLLATPEDLLVGFETQKFTYTDGDQTGLELMHDPRNLAGAKYSKRFARDVFAICIGRVEARGLIRRLSFGDYVLLQPELLDAYASSIVNAAKTEPDGLGSVPLPVVQAGQFPMSKDERVINKSHEKVLLLATIEDLLTHECALQVHSDEGTQLVFPTQFTRDWEDAPDPPGQRVLFVFEGPLLNIYATLAVRLSHSLFFNRQQMWRSAATFSAQAGGICGFVLREFGEARGELRLFFQQDVSDETAAQFEAFVLAHLQKAAIPQTIQRIQLRVCPECQMTFPRAMIEKCLGRDLTTIVCPVDRTEISIIEDVRRLRQAQPAVAEMTRAADRGRDAASAESILQGKITTNDFDVFLCYNRADLKEVHHVAKALRARGILPWLDESELTGGDRWLGELTRALGTVHSAIIFVGPGGFGSFQEQEVARLVATHASNKRPRIIPLLLRDAMHLPSESLLNNFQFIDFGSPPPTTGPKPMDRLIAAVQKR